MSLFEVYLHNIEVYLHNINVHGSRNAKFQHALYTSPTVYRGQIFINKGNFLPQSPKIQVSYHDSKQLKSYNNINKMYSCVRRQIGKICQWDRNFQKFSIFEFIKFFSRTFGVGTLKSVLNDSLENFTLGRVFLIQ